MYASTLEKVREDLLGHAADLHVVFELRATA
jgi:hypothetical protein